MIALLSLIFFALVMSVGFNIYFVYVMLPEYDKIIKDVQIFLNEDNKPEINTVSESIFIDDLEEMKLLKQAMAKYKKEYPENIAGGWHSLARSNKEDYTRDARRYNELARRVAQKTQNDIQPMKETLWPGTL